MQEDFAMPTSNFGAGHRGSHSPPLPRVEAPIPMIHKTTKPNENKDEENVFVPHDQSIDVYEKNSPPVHEKCNGIEAIEQNTELIRGSSRDVDTINSQIHVDALEVGASNEERKVETSSTENQVDQKCDDAEVKSSTANSIFETPARPKTSRFVFLSDQKQVPSDLKRLQQRTIRRRRDLLARMHDLDSHLAHMTCKYAEEKMDLDLAIHDTFYRIVCSPLEAAAERLVMERESSASRAPAVASLESRLSKLDRRLTRHVYVTLNDAKREDFDVLHDALYQEIIPASRIENSKSDKIEGGVIRRYENVSGMVARRFHEESTGRRSAVEFVQKKVEIAAHQQEQCLGDIIEVLSELRAKIRTERQERKAADKKIMEEIVKTTVVMKRALLEAVATS